jgi:monofunctional biosynthetic peptidoglycan transglycosylase
MKLMSRLGSLAVWLARLILLALLVDGVYLAHIWPDWSRLARQAVPESRFMQDYRQQARADGRLPPMSWQVVSIEIIPEHLIQAVLIAEDDRFYQHRGFDLIALREVLREGLEEGRLARGASTISQQTVKNLYFSPERKLLRKWHEAVFTWAMEVRLSKRRILEIYLNIAEFGRGVYGLQAAARHYWGREVAQLTLRQAAELAASLPSPVRHNPRTRTRFFSNHADRIEQRLRHRLGSGQAQDAGQGPRNAALPQDMFDSDAALDAEYD